VRSFHNGLDLAAANGTPVYAAMEGRVIDAGYSTILGNYIGISHHLGYQSFYGHLSKVSVKTGQYVVMGQYIGNVGSTGYSTGSHLHFSVLKWGRSLDPRIVMR
jgi:murein DD-endopeptidase MepM/ murein hydrolase activator NlpD